MGDDCETAIEYWKEVLEAEGCPGGEMRHCRVALASRVSLLSCILTCFMYQVLSLNDLTRLSHLKGASHPRTWLEAWRLQPDEVRFLLTKVFAVFFVVFLCPALQS